MTTIDLRPARPDVPLWRILDAIAVGEVRPHYQPIVSLETGEVVAVEALARWATPHDGFVSPATFIPVLEQANRVSDLTAFMLDRACADLAAWQRQFPLRAGFRVAINVSATELSDRRLAALVHEALAQHHIAAESLCLELTETAPIGDLDAVGRVLAELTTDIGVQLAVDDYGTGFAAGDVLAALPFDTVKIDRSFVASMEHRPDHAAFVEATVGYAEHRSMRVVGEGIQTSAQAAALRAVGCRLGQGFALGMPCPAEEIVDVTFGALVRPTAGV